MGAVLFGNSCYFAYAYIENFGSFNSQYPNYLLAAIYACNSLFVLAGLLGGRKKYSPDLIKLGKTAVVCLLLYSIVLVMHFYFWGLGMLLSIMNILISVYFVVLAVKMLHKKNSHH